MSKTAKKSALLTTSAATDVKRSGGVVSITGLVPFRDKDILSIKQYKYKAEVSQVIKVGGGSYTPTGATKYAVKLINPAYGKDGNILNVEKVYSYTTPVDITDLGATAALQREAIHAALVVKINADSGNLVSAVSLGTGTGFTITDDAGYYPARVNGKKVDRPATNVVVMKNQDGTGWTPSSNYSVTTAAVYGFGVGARMLQDTPYIIPNTGGLLSGEIDAPKTLSGTYASSGQQYDAFGIQSINLSSVPTVTGVSGFQIFEQFIFVDNGAGSSTTNATGFAAFEKEMQRLQYGIYKNDPSAIVDFFDNGIVCQSVTVAGTGLPSVANAPTGAAGDINSLSTGSNVLHYAIIGTATAISPIWTSSGLNLDQDATDNDGLEISAPIGGPKKFVVGKDEFSMFARVTIADVSDVEFLHFGFRKSEAYQTADGGYATYTDLAAIGFDTETATQAIKIITNLNDAASPTSTDTALTWADAATKELEIRVYKDRSVSFFVNGANVTSTQASAFSFDDGDTVIPYIYHQLGTSSAPSVVISKLFVVPDAYTRI